MNFLDIAGEAADAAGRAIRPWFRAVDPGTERKDDASPVTRADRDAERAMRDVLAHRAPGHAVLGEEFGAAEGADAGGGRYRWVLDPIDGTRAFITGRPSFATLIALLDDGVPILGLIDQPVTGERWIGLRGEATRFSGPLGGVAGTRRGVALGAMELSATAPAMFPEAARARFDALSDSVGRVSWGGDAYAYGLLALGHIDVIAEASMKIWDWAALVPVIEGAGGRVTDWQGNPLCADGPAPGGRGEVLAVGDPSALAAVVAALGGGAPKV